MPNGFWILLVQMITEHLNPNRSHPCASKTRKVELNPLPPLQGNGRPAASYRGYAGGINY